MTDQPPAETPPTPPTPPPAPTYGAPTSALGEAYKVRTAVSVIIFSIITLGIYFLYWTYQVFRELKEHTGQGIGPIIALVIGIVISPVNWFVLPSEIGNMYQAGGQEKPVSGATGFWNLIPFVGWIIWVVKVQGALNRVWAGEVAV
jgi:Domain of unknown function (DUF4234)